MDTIVNAGCRGETRLRRLGELAAFTTQSLLAAFTTQSLTFHSSSLLSITSTTFTFHSSRWQCTPIISELRSYNFDHQSVSQSATMANPTSLEGLPAEILGHILDLLPEDALANLRLASKNCQQRAEIYLYRHLHLCESPRPAARAREIIQQRSLASLVREVTLWANSSAPLRYESDLVCVSNDLRKLIRLRSLNIKFRPIIPSAFGIQHNSDLFAALFSALMVSHFLSCGLDRLSITHLQSRVELFVTTRVEFSIFLRNIRILELGIWTLKYYSSLQWRAMSTETMRFYRQLPQTWLAPASPNLRMLHLSADDPWGWYPKVDFRGIYFPHLRDLTLVRFIFSHDWHLQWLSDHATTLQRLTLMECSILAHAASTRQNFDSEGYPFGIDPRGEYIQVQGSHNHKKRWSHYLSALENTLPRLMSFSLISPDHVSRGRHPQAVLGIEILSIRGYHRYLEYHTNHSYSPLFGDEFGTLDEIKTHKLCAGERQAQQAEDEQALRAPFATIERRNGIRA